MSTNTSSFEATTVVFTYPGSSMPGLKAMAKRYVALDQTDSGSFGLTLVLTHCIGAFKEIYEPILEKLLKIRVAMEGSSGQLVPLIREAWSIEWQHHGESAVLNHPVISRSCDGSGSCCFHTSGSGCHEWVRAVKHFVRSKVSEGHRLVGIGHSAGACAIISSAVDCLPGEKIPYESIIIIEDSLGTRDQWEVERRITERLLNNIMSGIAKRQTFWPDRQHAHKYLSERMPWKLWDPRILTLYARHALRDALPSESDTPMVTLACSVQHEISAYTYEGMELYSQAPDHLAALDPSFDVHMIYGERHDILSKGFHDSILNCRKMASVQRISGAGHLAVQDNPDGVADAIESALYSIISRMPKSRL
ncbi:hypothetical protein CERSUDRAFT_119014 [Gelatoporia subvermispora B]|uniref:AB hydrolase-1 domain-containing protein n=1 Tax=Ceriporiopsis subvermispora (strain B) TaxID=914234 RepID=M2Q639_CERS8|nr:hypothetical protein CERSUDRAFT_119014 [Gelatoporia subvermispora B]